ncbi:MAG: HlyD family efflux transporter periplasmic adaptor subunit [Acidobacteriota bacterium]
MATPAPATAAPPQAAPQLVPPLAGAFDPHAMPLPPELAPAIYGWMRRLALQADLTGADRLLRDALADLTSALAVTIIYPGPDGLTTLVTDDELPKDTQPIVAVAAARRAIITSHAALVPIATATETIAVISLQRNSHQPGFTLADQIAMAAFARESANVMHHLVVQHLQRANERKADAGSLYRPEALESHRTRGQEGVLADLSPGWVKRAYPMLIITIAAALALGMVLHVNTWSTGSGIIVFDGKEITAPQSGTVDVVAVHAGEQVHEGELLVKLRSEDVEAQLRQTSTELEKQIQEHLFDPTDENVSKQLAIAAAAAKRAQANVDQRSVRASEDGVVSDIRVRLGQLLQPGEHILTLVEPGTLPEVWAFLPGKDRPRLHEGQDLQVDLIGFTKKRELARITHVSNEVIGAAAARKFVGPEYADSLKLEDGAYVLVKARLPRDSFMSKGQKLYVHHGMPVKSEVRVERKRFITTLLPALEKYVE